ncbi:MAG TPA: hypothetical protein VFL13_04440 [Candidatus Baltobacteraceae bacterium]|nr:hypothetical protein [Candidatus Baltobacteraceae bacterium]
MSFAGLARGLVLAAAVLPLSAIAAPAPSVVHYATSLTPLHENAPYTGSLELTYAPDGTIHGYYFPSDYSAMFVPVVGGLSDGNIWLEIGTDNVVRVQGHLHDGVIDGGAIGQTESTSYAFTASPADAGAAAR